MKKRIEFFGYSSGAILLLAGLERLLVATRNAQILALPDILLGFPLRSVVLLVGGLEFLVAAICLFGRSNLKIGFLAWLATNYVVYRIGLILLHYHQQATCIGSLTDPLQLTRGMTGDALNLVPVYILLGSYTALICIGWKTRAERAGQYLKMSCPGCGIHIRFDQTNTGREMPCPHCRKSLVLRRPGDLKISCFFCKEHIEFPAHALGQKISCPHCGMDITLKEPA